MIALLGKIYHVVIRITRHLGMVELALEFLDAQAKTEEFLLGVVQGRAGGSVGLFRHTLLYTLNGSKGINNTV